MDLVEQDVKKRLGLFLREVRERRHLSLGDISIAIGRSKTYVCDVESGRRGGSRMPPDVVTQWAAYLDIPVSAIAERQRVRGDVGAITNTQRYRSYMRILRNRTRSTRIYKAVSELRDLVRASQSELTPAQTRELFGRVAQNVEVIDTCLVYQR
jgi:transcriptional regulator with XRE-family HTH domain